MLFTKYSYKLLGIAFDDHLPAFETAVNRLNDLYYYYG